MPRRRTGRQRAASRRNLAKARAVKSRQSGDTFFGYFGRMAFSASVSAATGGKGKAISDFIEGKGTPGQIRKRKKVAYLKRVARRSGKK